MTLPRPVPPTPVDAVIFDADGTLVDSETPSLEVLHAHALALGVPFAPGEGVETWRGRPMPDSLAELARRLGRPLPPDFEAVMRAAMADRFREGLLAMPGAHALLRALQAQQTPFCVATNGPRHKVELTLALTGLRDFFGERLFCAYEVGVFKPEPGLFLAAAQALGAQPGRCVVVEDSPPGIAAGLAAGMQVYALRSPMVEALQPHPRLRVVQGLEDLLREPWMAAA